MGNLKSREFYPDFHVNIRKDGRVNGVEPVTLKDMGFKFAINPRSYTSTKYTKVDNILASAPSYTFSYHA